jgi:hypothetical protein
MGYQYALHQHKKKLRQEKSELRKSQENNSASSRSYWDEHSEMSGEGQHSPGKRTVQGALAHRYQRKRKTSYKKCQKQL